MTQDAVGADLLSQLRDIQAAPEAPWWPPAPGWWVLAALTVVALYWVTMLIQSRRQQRRLKQDALERLASLRRSNDPDQQPQAYLSAVNGLLKVIAIRAFSEQSCANLQGNDWTGFLLNHLGDNVQEQDRSSVLALASGPYQPSPEFDPAALERVAGLWIKRHG